MGKRLPLEFIYDVSGTPMENTYIGMFSLNQYTKDAILTEFTSEFPELRNLKGRQLRKADFLKIISFLNERKVRMRVCIFTRNDWRYYWDQYNKDSQFKVKMSSLIFFKMAESIMWNNQPYSIVSCVESQLGSIDHIFHFMNHLASRKNIRFDCSHGRGSFNRVVQIADYIAYSGKMIKVTDLEDIQYYEFIESRFSEYELKYLF